MACSCYVGFPMRLHKQKNLGTSQTDHKPVVKDKAPLRPLAPDCWLTQARDSGVQHEC